MPPARRRADRAQEETTDDRDFVMARLLAAGAAIEAARSAHAELALHMVDPSEDADGRERATLLEDLDAAFTAGAQAAQAAMARFRDVDPRQGEDDEEDEEEGQDERPEPRRRGRG